MKKTIVLKQENNDHQEFDWGSLTWYASRHLGNTTEVTIGKCVLKPGMGNPPHQHPNSNEILTVLEGRIMHQIEDGKEVEMVTGDTISLPPKLPHKARNIGKNEAILLVVFPTADREVKGE